MRIATGLVDRLLAEAALSPAVEICGLLIGRPDAIEAAIPAANVSPAPADSFEIDPAVLIAAHRAERAGGPLVLGCYHSHPLGPAAPSARDRAAAEHGRLWLILGGGEARLWRMARDGFTEIAFPRAPADEGGGTLARG